MTETVTLKQKANKFEQNVEQLSLKFNGLASCVTKQLDTIDSNPVRCSARREMYLTTQ